MVKRVVVGAHYGLRDWLAQRITAVVMALYTVLLVTLLVARAPLDHTAWKSLFTHGAMRVLTLLFLLSLFYHAWVGVRDILMDYVKPTAIRLTLEVAVILALVGYTIWSISILWSA
jgi:succinate dehydrogenase / fumarate reductase, membrane anchor subunit